MEQWYALYVSLYSYSYICISREDGDHFTLASVCYVEQWWTSLHWTQTKFSHCRNTCSLWMPYLKNHCIYLHQTKFIGTIAQDICAMSYQLTIGLWGVISDSKTGFSHDDLMTWKHAFEYVSHHDPMWHHRNDQCLKICECEPPDPWIACRVVLAWWRNQMETFSTLLAICVGNSPVPGEVPVQRPVTWSFDVFFDLRLNKRLSKQW